MLVLAAGALAFEEDRTVTGLPSRDGNVDISINITIPEEDGSYQTEFGLHAQVNVTNIGTEWANGTGFLSMKIKNRNTGETAFTALNVQFTEIGPGQWRLYSFQNWSMAVAGQFRINVSAAYMGDSDLTNNYQEGNFSMWTEDWPFPPNIEAWTVTPMKGNTTTEFNYTTVFKHNEAPVNLFLEIDGVNHSMIGSDIDDQVYQDGKAYHLSTFLPIGNHRYRLFAEVDGWTTIETNMMFFPWVNVSLKNPQVSPFSGYVTTPFKFSVDYGSVFNLPPDDIYVDTGSKRFDLTRSSPTPNYLKGDVRFEADVPGMELLPSPLTYYINSTTELDHNSLGPFDLEGPSMEMVNISGTITDLDMNPLGDVNVTLEPGPSVLTDELGRYSVQVNKGPNFHITFVKEGYLNKEYELDILEDRRLDISMEHLPEGSSVSGSVMMEDGGSLVPVEGVSIVLSGPIYANETISGVNGSYVLGDIPAGSGYTLTARGERFENFVHTLSIPNGQQVLLNITMVERDMGISISPMPSEGPIPKDAEFTLSFPMEPDISTLNVSLSNGTAFIPLDIAHETNSTSVNIISRSPLIFDTLHTLTVKEGASSIIGPLMVWRDISWNYISLMQQPLEQPSTDPVQDSLSVPLDSEISISWGIGLNISSFSFELLDLDRVQVVEASMEFSSEVNWSDSGRSDTWITIAPVDLSFDTRYSLEVDGGLQDLYGRTLFTTIYSLEFMTVGEPDTDGDGYVDSIDDFPHDPNEWKDLDGDGYGDRISDLFPSDPTEWMDTDGDGIGNNADTDDDNDGMPDEWELKNGLDPLDPADAFGDLDGDGSTNLEEYLADTDPTDVSSKPESGEFTLPKWMLMGGIVVLVMIAVAVVILISRSREGETRMEE